MLILEMQKGPHAFLYLKLTFFSFRCYKSAAFEILKTINYT